MYAVTGLSAIGAAFVAVALVLAVFAVGYVAIAYNLLQVGLYGMFGPTLSGYLADKVGLDLPWWVWSLGAWLLVAVLGVLRADLNGRVLRVLLSAEVLVLLVLSLAGLGDPASGVPLTSLTPGGLFGHPGLGALLVTALLGYVGFEAAAVFSEEARLPRRTVPVATYASLAIIGAAYALARTEPSTGAPRVASLTQSAIGLVVIALYALAGWDPMVRLFFWGRHHRGVRGPVPAGGHLPGRPGVLRRRPRLDRGLGLPGRLRRRRRGRGPLRPLAALGPPRRLPGVGLGPETRG